MIKGAEILIDDPYIERRQAFLDAALPSGEVGIEHTFDLFLEDFEWVYEKRLQNKLSDAGLIMLLGASLQERNERQRDWLKLQKIMDFLFEQVPPDDDATGAQLISEAYNAFNDSRHIRYNHVLDNLSTSDRDIIQTEFFDKLSVNIGPLPSNSRHYEMTVTIEFPDGKPNRIERKWTYLLARGMPVKKTVKNSYSGGGIVSVS